MVMENPQRLQQPMKIARKSGVVKWQSVSCEWAGRGEEPEEDAGSETGSEASVAYGVMGEPYIPGTAKEESMIALARAAAEKRRLREAVWSDGEHVNGRSPPIALELELPLVCERSCNCE